MRHRLNESLEILIAQFQFERNPACPQKNLGTCLKLEFVCGGGNGVVHELPQVRHSGPDVAARRNEQHGENAGLFSLPPCFQFGLHAIQVWRINDAEVEGLIQGWLDHRVEEETFTDFCRRASDEELGEHAGVEPAKQREREEVAA